MALDKVPFVRRGIIPSAKMFAEAGKAIFPKEVS